MERGPGTRSRAPLSFWSLADRMEQFFQQVTNGLAVGSIYALIALGYTMVYGVLRLINFAHGDLFTYGAYLGMTLLVVRPPGPPRARARPARARGHGDGARRRHRGDPRARGVPAAQESPRLSAVVSALGASIFLQNALMLVFGARYQVYPDILPQTSVSLLGQQVPVMRLVVVVVSLAIMAALYLFVQKTKTGVAIRAAAIDPGRGAAHGHRREPGRPARLRDRPRARRGAGVLVGLYYGQINFTMGWIYGMKAFTAAILGGIGNIPGAMLGGLLLGVVEALGATYLSIAWKDAIAFFVLIVILIVRPSGLLGERVAEKV